MVDQRQPKAASADRSVVVDAAHEGLADMLPLVGRDAGALVLHTDLGGFTGFPHHDADLTVCILQRVVY
jgi:hypothetical protein